MELQHTVRFLQSLIRVCNTLYLVYTFDDQTSPVVPFFTFISKISAQNEYEIRVQQVKVNISTKKSNFVATFQKLLPKNVCCIVQSAYPTIYSYCFQHNYTIDMIKVVFTQQSCLLGFLKKIWQMVDFRHIYNSLAFAFRKNRFCQTNFGYVGSQSEHFTDIQQL